MNRIRGRSVSIVLDGDVVDLEEERRAGLEPGRDQVLDHLGLAVDDDRPAAGELAQRDPVPLAVELELDPVVDDPLAPQAVADPGRDEQVDGALLEHAGPDALLDVLAAAVLEHDGLDPRLLEQAAEREPGRAGADDPDLGPHQPAASSSTR